MSALEAIDAKIASAKPSELPDLIRARGILLEQDEAVKQGQHIRWGQKANFFAKVGFAVGAVAGGAFLMSTGLYVAGFFLVGGGTFIFVPDYVRDHMPKLPGGGSDGL